MTRSTIGGRNGGKETYKDEDDEDDVAYWGHGYPRRQPERDASPGHGERREKVEVENKGCWVMMYESKQVLCDQPGYRPHPTPADDNTYCVTLVTAEPLSTLCLSASPPRATGSVPDSPSNLGSGGAADTRPSLKYHPTGGTGPPTPWYLLQFVRYIRRSTAILRRLVAPSTPAHPEPSRKSTFQRSTVVGIRANYPCINFDPCFRHLGTSPLARQEVNSPGACAHHITDVYVAGQPELGVLLNLEQLLPTEKLYLCRPQITAPGNHVSLQRAPTPQGHT